MVKIDSPVSRRIVHSFLDFLKSVEPAPGVDLEGLEVVRECLEDVFKLNPSSVDEQTQPGLLVKHFSSLDSNKQHESRSGQAVTFQNASSTSSTGDAQASPSHTAKQQDEDCVGELHTSGVSKDELFGHFFAELDKIHFFSTANDVADDSWLLDRATHLFHEAVKELERSGCQTVESLNLAETFKLQGNRAMQSKLYSDAIELYTYAIALCQSNSVYYCNRAAAFTQIHKYIEAITDCKKSIEIDPNYSKAYSRLGLAYYAQGNYRDAIDKGFLKALQLDPNNSSVKENIRVAEQKLRDLRRTEQHQNGSSTNHSNQESTNGQARGGPRNHSVPSSVYTDMNFNPAGLPSDITRMFMNMVGQQHPQGTNDGTDIGSSDEPGIRLGGNFSVDIGEEMPVDLMGSLRAAMERFSGAAQPRQNSQGDGHRGPAPN